MRDSATYEKAKCLIGKSEIQIGSASRVLLRFSFVTDNEPNVSNANNFDDASTLTVSWKWEGRGQRYYANRITGDIVDISQSNRIRACLRNLLPGSADRRERKRVGKGSTDHRITMEDVLRLASSFGRKIERKDVSERQHARAWDARLESWRFFDKFRGSAGNGEADERDSGGARWKSSNKPYVNSSPIRGLGGLCHGPPRSSCCEGDAIVGDTERENTEGRNNKVENTKRKTLGTVVLGASNVPCSGLSSFREYGSPQILLEKESWSEQSLVRFHLGLCDSRVTSSFSCFPRKFQLPLRDKQGRVTGRDQTTSHSRTGLPRMLAARFVSDSQMQLPLPNTS
uniref:Uncharacterized protein n=1 Tax=Vespula pensylvanica TaxID=30213 RepID=A0A834KMF9_VESPE|nr:hypothetical protein H0235_013241 [Vespula pensylvanica]